MQDGVTFSTRTYGRLAGFLEVGIGTGHNLPYYAEGATLNGIDVSIRMLERARSRAAALGVAKSG